MPSKTEPFYALAIKSQRGDNFLVRHPLGHVASGPVLSYFRADASSLRARLGLKVSKIVKVRVTYTWS